ncbi:MAG: Rpn family recombination-promoting nuclease/putative transposase [Lachnospiraceae bacterium]|nr:Rpn family recombination-promoting nuclease/putative transposase [Lachnospiraceae bacterium]
MEVQNSLANLIDTAADEAQYDEVVKKMLAYRVILAWMLKECAVEFKQYSIAQIMECIEPATISVEAVDQDELDYIEEIADTQIEGMATEDVSKREGKAIYDIKFSAHVPGTEEPVQLIINIEAQKDDNTPYPLIKRAIYYVSRLISAQKNKVFVNKHYEKIRKVYSIWIQMNVSGAKANTITKYQIHEENVVGEVKEKEANYNLLTVIMIGLGNPELALDEPILRILDILLSTDTKPDKKKEILQNDYNIAMSKEMIEEANIMCNLGEGIREKTEIKTKAQSIIDLMDSMGINIEKAMELLKIKSDDKDVYRQSVGNMLAIK